MILLTTIICMTPIHIMCLHYCFYFKTLSFYNVEYVVKCENGGCFMALREMYSLVSTIPFSY